METKINIASQLKEDYLSYSMAVLIGRSIPDIYDGLKPAQRRLLQTMLEEGLMPHKPYVKCARTTGLTSAYYHPHGSAYGALINMATPWTNNVPWIDCHGNIGSSVDGPAAERYVENRLRQSAIDILLQDSDIWETRPNYDGSRKEAIRFNTSLPSVLLNGDSGIAVGFATKLAPHGLDSIVDGIKLICKSATSEKARLENIRQARQLLAPDFPTGCNIVHDDQLDNYMKTGSGNIRCVSRVEKSVSKGSGKRNHQSLIFTCLPPGTNPEKIGEQIKAELDRGRITGVSAINDLSDIEGDRLEVVAKSNTDIEELKNQLFSHTDLDTKYSAKTLVIEGTKPVELSPIDIIKKWVVWRTNTLKEKFLKELGIRSGRLHIIEGFLRAIDKMDLIIKKIRSAKDRAEAKSFLMGGSLKFTNAQADAILEMRLRQLTNLDHSDLLKEKDELLDRIKELEALSEGSPEGDKKRKSYMVSEISSLGKKYGSGRKSPILQSSEVSEKQKGEKIKSSSSSVSKSRFLKIDLSKGVIQQVKGPRGATVLDSKEKLVVMTEDGTLRKVLSNFKGAISSGYAKVSLAKREIEVSKRQYLTVFELDGDVKAMVIRGEDLCKSTSKPKKWLPDGANLLYFGEESYTLNWQSTRKKPITLDLKTKVGKPGGKGIKIGEKKDLKL